MKTGFGLVIWSLGVAVFCRTVDSVPAAEANAVAANDVATTNSEDGGGPKDDSIDADWFPPIEPFKEEWLRVSEVHEIRYELCGNPDGIPVMILHGGPGGGSYPSLRRYHDPDKYLMVLHDQRGAGKSRPYSELRDNNTQALVEDVEKLRRHLNLGRVHIFGGSWGSTLGVAYAEAYPEQVRSLVLRGVFLGSQEEIDHFYHGGSGAFFPEAYARLRSHLPHPDRPNYPTQLLALLRSDNEAVRKKIAFEWARYEMKLAYLERDDEDIDRIVSGWETYDFALIENYYMVNHCFLLEGQLLREAHRLANIPAVIVHGRYDVICRPKAAWDLHRAMPKSRLVLVESAGHSGGAEPIRRALVNAVKSLESSE
jgi:proline iminopeptidase